MKNKIKNPHKTKCQNSPTDAIVEDFFFCLEKAMIKKQLAFAN